MRGVVRGATTMSIFRSAFERILGLRVWVLVTGLLVLGGVTAVVAQTNTDGSGSADVSTLAGRALSHLSKVSFLECSDHMCA